MATLKRSKDRGGFYGPVSHLIRKQPSTRWVNIEGPLKPYMFDLAPFKRTGMLEKAFIQ